METCLVIEHLSKTYRGNWLFDSTRAVEDVSFEVGRGERLGLLGGNGAGKTTTFKAVAGLIRPTSGRISLFGLPPRRREARTGLGYLPETPYFHDFLTGEECVMLAARLVGVPAPERSQRVAEILDAVGLDAARRRQIRTYSKGMTQRVGIAQALVGRPALAILDEPMTGLDPVGRREIRDLITALPSQGTTVVYSTHVLQDVELSCDRIVMLARGRVVRQGTLAEMLGGEDAPIELTVKGLDRDAALEVARSTGAELAADSPAGVVLQARDAAAAESVRAALAARGGRVVAMVPRARTLEDVFVSEMAGAARGAER